MTEVFGVESGYVVTDGASQRADQYPGRTTGDKPPIDADAPPEEDR